MARVIAVVGEVHEATVALLFNGLRSDDWSFRFISFAEHPRRVSAMLHGCDAAIIVRNVFHPLATVSIDSCNRRGIPLYYLTDDNLTVLAEQSDFQSLFLLPSLRARLAPFAGVICASQALVDYMKENKVHARVHRFEIVFDAATHARLLANRHRGNNAAVRIAFTGGPFRQANMASAVYPAIGELSAAVKTIVCVPSSMSGYDASALGTANLQQIDRTADYAAFLNTWSSRAPDILVHPAGDLADAIVRGNIVYKNENILLVACHLGAAPIVTDEPAFAETGEDQGVIKVSGDQRSWTDAIERLLDARCRTEQSRRLEAYCRSRFAGAMTMSTLSALSMEWPERRRRKGIGALFAEQAYAIYPVYRRGRSMARQAVGRLLTSSRIR